MKIDRKLSSLLVSILLVSLLLSFIPQTSINPETTLRGVVPTGIENPVVSGSPHGSITIDGNGDFKLIAEAESWDGDGSEETPYIIEGFDFDRGGTDGSCIDITDTTAHFVIRNCSFTGATASGRAGISLVNVTNCEVSDNFFSTNYNGIHLDCNNARILNNEIEMNAWYSGISVLSLNHSIVSGNTIDGGGGFNGFSMEYVESCEISHNTIRNTASGSMKISHSSNFIISDNDCINGGSYGISYFDTHNSTITRNNCSYSSYGIAMLTSTNNYVNECTLENNTNGIRLWDSQNNYIELCEILNNEERGLEIHATATSNLFKWNIFRNHSIANVIDDSTGNIADYNYYDNYIGLDFDDDGIGDIPYLLSGSTGNVDNHPLVLEPGFPVWNPSPSNQYLELGERFNYDLEIASSIFVDDWTISDTFHFMIDDAGIIRDIGVLDVGSYPIDVVVTNVYGLSLEGSFLLTVEDSVNPVWISQVQDKSYSFGEDIAIQLIAWDLAGVESWEISNSDNFTMTSTAYAETGIVTITGNANTPVGTYSLTLMAYDPSGNYVAATFTITVTVDSGPVGAINFELVMSTAGLVLGFVALIIGIVSFLKTRKST